MTFEQELLKGAACAIKLDISFDIQGECFILSDGRKHPLRDDWNPLKVQADADNLCKALNMRIEYHDGGVSAFVPGAVQGYFEDITDDAAAAFRWAVVRAAAAQP